MISIDDNDVKALRHGDDHAMKKLFDAYHKQLYLYAFGFLRDRHDAEDVTSQALAACWHRRAAMDDARHVNRYLYILTKNMSIDLIRCRMRRSTCVVEEEEDQCIKMEPPFVYERLDAAVEAHFMEKMVREIDNMPPQRKQVMSLLLLGRPILKIARAMGISKKSAYTHKYEALKQIRQSLHIKTLKDSK